MIAKLILISTLQIIQLILFFRYINLSVSFLKNTKNVIEVGRKTKMQIVLGNVAFSCSIISSIVDSLDVLHIGQVTIKEIVGEFFFTAGGIIMFYALFRLVMGLR